eukprot:2739387-Amphidinium_carterae.1
MCISPPVCHTNGSAKTDLLFTNWLLRYATNVLEEPLLEPLFAAGYVSLRHTLLSGCHTHVNQDGSTSVLDDIIVSPSVVSLIRSARVVHECLFSDHSLLVMQLDVESVRFQGLRVVRRKLSDSSGWGACRGELSSEDWWLAQDFVTSIEGPADCMVPVQPSKRDKQIEFFCQAAGVQARPKHSCRYNQAKKL